MSKNIIAVGVDGKIVDAVDIDEAVAITKLEGEGASHLAVLRSIAARFSNPDHKIELFLVGGESIDSVKSCSYDEIVEGTTQKMLFDFRNRVDTHT